MQKLRELELDLHSLCSPPFCHSLKESEQWKCYRNKIPVYHKRNITQILAQNARTVNQKPPERFPKDTKNFPKISKRSSNICMAHSTIKMYICLLS